MNIDDAALCLLELGHVTRLHIYRYLVKTGRQGVPVGDIQKQLEIPASTLSHHISRLTQVGLVAQKRDGRILLCTAQYDKLQDILGFLTSECCEGEACLTLDDCCVKE